MLFRSGTTEPLELRFEIAGRVRDIHVKEGQQVRADEVLAELDQEAIELSVRIAEAAVRTAELQSELTQNGPEHAVAESSPAAVTRQVSATSKVRATEQLIAKSRLEAAEAVLQKERLLLEQTRLKSPMNGTIVECTVQNGELVGPQLPSAAFRIVDRSKTHVRAWVEELDAMDVRTGMPAMVVASGSVDRKYRGVIISCASYVQPKSERHLNPGERVDVRVREIVIELKDAEDLLLGLPVEVFIAPRRDARKDTGENRKLSARTEN